MIKGALPQRSEMNMNKNVMVKSASIEKKVIKYQDFFIEISHGIDRKYGKIWHFWEIHFSPVLLY